MGYIDSIMPMQGAGAKVMSMAYDNADAADDVSVNARIAELEQELADIRRRRAGRDTEAEMAKYKFQFEGDPSSYMNYKQGLRTNAATENIRKATEAATKASQLQADWKQNAIELDEWQMKQNAAKLAYEDALAKNDEIALKKAQADIENADRGYARAQREQAYLRSKMRTAVGYDDTGDRFEQPRAVSTKKNNLARDIENMQTVNDAKADLALLEEQVSTDNVSISDDEKAGNVANWQKRLDGAMEIINNSSLNSDTKLELKTKAEALSKKINDYNKPTSKGGQTTTMTKEKYEKMFVRADGSPKNTLEQAALGLSVLEAAKKAGVNVDEKAIKIAKTKTKK